MRIAVICAAALAVVAGSTPALADETAEPSSKVQASSCYIPQLIAHRGGGGVGSQPYYLENSWPAFEKSVKLGVKVLETDVRWTSDGVPILMHDAELSRTTNGSGLVQNVDINYIKSLELKNGGGKIPLFDEFLQFAKNNDVEVWPEYKPEAQISNAAWINDYAARIQASGVKAVIPSFLKTGLAEFKVLLPDYPQIWFHSVITDGPTVKPSQVPSGAYAGLINIVLNQSVADAMKKADVTVYAWYNEFTRGDDPAGWEAMAKLKPVGIITDYPEQYQQWAATTDYCKKPKKQKAKCAKLPKSLPGDATVVLLNKTCKTNAGQKITVKVSGKGETVKGKNGRISVKTKPSGKVTVTYKAKKTAEYAAFKKAKTYRLK